MNSTTIRVGHNEDGHFEETEEITPSERGYQFQFRLTRKLLERLSGFSTVKCYDMDGNLINLQNIERRGADGGLDLLIIIRAANRRATRQVTGKVWKVIEEL